jgi:predicted ArsR family transcriptional regulator
VAELAAREALLRGAFADAEARAGEAAVLRHDSLDNRGVSRALAIAAEAADRQGARGRAADLYFRAGRGAVARGEPEGRRWLQRAEALARQSGDRVLAESARAAARPPAE